MVLLKDAEWSGWADGPRFSEPVTDRFAPEIADDIAVNLKEGEGEQIGQALVATRMERCRAVAWASRRRNS